MSERVSEVVLLCEDDAHERLVREYLNECGHSTRPPKFRVRNASREVHGGNVGWVIKSLPAELAACRRRNTRARTLLIVFVDADHHSVDDRRAHVDESGAISSEDPAVVLIPRRHVETWIHAGNGETVNESADYKGRPLGRQAVRSAARAIRMWAHDSPSPKKPLVDSLQRSLPSWRRIG